MQSRMFLKASTVALRGVSCFAPRLLCGSEVTLGSQAAGGLSKSSGAKRAFAEASKTTSLGAYLERCGANWEEAAEAQGVESESGHKHTWRVELPPARLASVRRGEALESAVFSLSGGGRARFQFFPKGDSESTDGFCSLWLCSADHPGRMRLRLGQVERSSGASDFAPIGVLTDSMEIHLEVDEAAVVTSRDVEQSLQLNGLQVAEWQLHRVATLAHGSRARKLVTSQPFRFHHVLLGDMYLEMLPGFPHPEHCTVFFRCRVPTMQLRVSLTVGSAFSKTFIAQGRSTPEADMKTGSCLQVNLDAPGVVKEDGSILVRCCLEEVVTIPPSLKDMIPRLDERALWPKRL